MDIEDAFSALTSKATAAAGSFWAFCIATLSVLGWAISGPFFGFSDSWQLVANTGTTLATFLMVFLIQHAQNKENRAVQLKLNEIIASSLGCSNRLIAAEDLTDKELQYLYKRFKHLAETAKLLEAGAKTSIDESEQ